MSSRSRPVVFSRRASGDLRDILVYGHRTWGPEQADAYEATIDRALQHISAFPQIGSSRDAWFPGCRSFAVGQHLILYSLEDEAIVVARIVHARRDIANELEE